MKPGDKIVGKFQNMDVPFIVTKIETDGPKVWMKHDKGEVHVRKQDIKDGTFELSVNPRS